MSMLKMREIIEFNPVAEKNLSRFLKILFGLPENAL
jgi:hypothetical protein